MPKSANTSNVATASDWPPNLGRSILEKRLLLTPEQVSYLANKLWNEVIESDWQGDLSILPAHGFPTAKTGLCKVKTRSMYDRLAALRPQRACTDAMKVLVHDDNRFGYFDLCQPVIRVSNSEEDQDMDKRFYGKVGEPLFDHGTDWKGIEYALEWNQKQSEHSISRRWEEINDAFSRLLVQIRMRQCWMDIIGPYVRKHPTNVATIAVMFGHFDLLKIFFMKYKRYINMKTWMEKFDYLGHSIRNKNVAMFQMPFALFKSVRSAKDLSTEASFKLDSLLVDPSGLGSPEGLAIIDMLDYYGDQYSRKLLDILLFDYDQRFSYDSRRDAYSFALSERLRPLQFQLALDKSNGNAVGYYTPSFLTPILTNLAEAQEYVTEMETVDADVLAYVAMTANFEFFIISGATVTNQKSLAIQMPLILTFLLGSSGPSTLRVPGEVRDGGLGLQSASRTLFIIGRNSVLLEVLD
ncbi:hypothetical protein HDU76_000256 [Blyttiomyces sp. JEL0837]|nr:hypothetical protein HDU76_000256 [Blyttiomyces sp. JEL0837]